MRIISVVFRVIIFSLLINCNNKSNYVVICSADGNNCITHFSFDSIQVLADGVHNSLPDSNFVIVDVSNKDLAVDNCLNICWGKKENKFKWEAVIARSIIINSKLDTSIHLFRTDLPLNYLGSPTEAKYRGDGCATLDIDLKRFTPPTSSSMIKKY